MKKADDLLLIGIGGAGCRLAADISAEFRDLRVLLLDTDARSLPDHPSSVLFGSVRLNGKSTGGDASIGRQAFLDSSDELVLPRLEGVRLAIIVTALGGGTGSGATPELLRLLHVRGVVTLCFVAMPFSFEGASRRQTAQLFYSLFESTADALVVMPLDSVFKGRQDIPLGEALEAVFGLLSAAILSFWRLLMTPGFIEMDSERLIRLLQKGGGARFDVCRAEGPDRVLELLDQVKRSELLDVQQHIASARIVLLGVLAGNDLRLSEISEIVDFFRSRAENGDVELGTVLDDSFAGRIELVVFTFDTWIAPPSVGQAVEPSATDRIPEMSPLIPAGRKSSRKRSAAGEISVVTGRGRFRDTAPTVYNGQDLDKPTYQRRGIVLDR